jgi:hypothetical protein
MKRAFASAWIGLVLVQGCTANPPSPVPPSPPEMSASPSSEPAAPVAATVTCSESGAVVSSDVQARSDGITLLIRNTTGHDINAAPGQVVDGAEPQREHGRLADGRWFESGALAFHGDSRVGPGAVEAQVWIVPPGSAGVACLGSWPPKVVAEFRVLDPAGLYHSPALACQDAYTYGMGFPSEVEGPVSFLRDRIRGLEEGDVVEFAEYPGQRMPVVRVVRDGRTIGVAYSGFPTGVFYVCRDTKLRRAGARPPPPG